LTGARIIFVPGLKPKPPRDAYRRELLRVLLAGLAQRRPEAARWLRMHPEAFVLVPWTELFYAEHRDIELDLPGIERLLAQAAPSAEELREVKSLENPLERVWHVIGDAVPPLGRWIARPATRLNMLEASRYLANRDGVATAIRALVSKALEDAWREEARVLLIGHSLGSVIAYDTLWELSRGPVAAREVDVFVTLGSPLATQFIRNSLLGTAERGAARYPTMVRRWVNLAAKGDMTALRPRLKPYFDEMLDFGLVDSIEDHVDLHNYFRGSLGLNPHEAYGYLVQAALADVVGDWLGRES
jgi:hypothetical protein